MDPSHRSRTSDRHFSRNAVRRRTTGCAAGFVLLFLLTPEATTAPAKDETPLATNQRLDVRVTCESKPLAGAPVFAFDGDKPIQTLTDRDGKAQLSLPTEAKLNGIVALDPQRGVSGQWSRSRKMPLPSDGVIRIALEPAKPHTFRVLDTEGKPARLVPLVVSSYRTWASHSVPTGAFDAAHLHTDARGIAVAAWLPRELSQVEVEIFDDRWTIDEVDHTQTDQGTTLVKVRRLRAVEGRLSMPEEASPEGLLIAGVGSSNLSSIHETSGRARRDGTFTLYMAEGYGYCLGVSDSRWASDPWIGGGEPGKQPPGPIQLIAYPARTLSVRVTRGPKHEPVAGAYLEVAGGEESMLWQQVRQQARLGSGSALGRLYTDRDGRAQIAVRNGKHTIWLEAGDWQETQTVDVAVNKPAAVEFHRAWPDKRLISGRLMLHGSPHPSGPATRVRAWNVSNPEVVADGVVEPDGRFTVKIDAPDVYLLAFDSANRLSAVGRVDVKHSTANLELIPTATLSGVVVDAAGKPLAGHAVEVLPTQGALLVEMELAVDQKGNALPQNMGRITVPGADFQMGSVVLQSAACDAQGRFKIDQVPAQMRVRVVAGSPAAARGRQFSLWPGRFRVDTTLDAFFDADEARENVRLVVPKEDLSASEVPAKFEPLEPHVKRLTRDARLAGMRLLVCLEGEAGKSDAAPGQEGMLNGNAQVLARYFPLEISTEELKSAGPSLTRLGWERPKAGEMELVILDESGAKIGSQRISRSIPSPVERRAAEHRLIEFLKRNAPPQRDAIALLTAAQREAHDTGRRLWLIDGGGLGEPCFELVRWMDDQHALLAKDFVRLQLLGTDARYEEAVRKFHTSGYDGSPWFAIAEPDGKVLVTNDGPLGSFVLPTSFEDKRHLKRMLDRTARHLTPAECKRLIDSLPEPAK